jgi:hypothetical protein
VTAGIRITGFEEHHWREQCDCGVEALNTYLRQYEVLLVDAKDEAAKRFYQGFGFRGLSDAPMTLFLPSETIVRGLLLTK